MANIDTLEGFREAIYLARVAANIIRSSDIEKQSKIARLRSLMNEAQQLCDDITTSPLEID